VSGDVDALKAALMGIPEGLLSLPFDVVADGYQQALASFNTLMAGSNNPLVPEVAAVLQGCANTTFAVSGFQDVVDAAMRRLVASM
jgi:hypothetical protein